MLSRDDRRAVTSMVYEAGSLLEAGRVQRALALAEDAYSFSREEGVETERAETHESSLYLIFRSTNEQKSNPIMI